MPSDQKAKPWPRFVAEGFTIVFGILLALGVDAWWDERTERAAEHVALEQLAAEFADNEAQLDSVLAIHRQGLEAAAILLGATRGEIDLSADSLRELIIVSDSPWTFNPKRGALESMLASGRLGIIRNDSLRVALAGWPAVLEDYAEEEWHMGEYTRGPQYDYLSSMLNWSVLYSPGELGSAESIERLIEDPGFQSVMAYRWSWFESVLSESDLVTDGSELIRRLIDRALGAD